MLASVKHLCSACVLVIFLLFPCILFAEFVYEISGSPFATDGAPMPEFIHTNGEKTILIDPNAHAWGAYSAKGKLIRWGIATAGSEWCADINKPCWTKTGSFRIYSMGGSDCISTKYPIPDGGAEMPYCMYFNGSEAIHGSSNVQFENISHGCVRVHISDARWLRYEFAEAPSAVNLYKGTRVIVKPYH